LGDYWIRVRLSDGSELPQCLLSDALGRHYGDAIGRDEIRNALRSIANNPL
jgi:hypothetical protein